MHRPTDRIADSLKAFQFLAQKQSSIEEMLFNYRKRENLQLLVCA